MVFSLSLFELLIIVFTIIAVILGITIILLFLKINSLKNELFIKN